MKIGNLAFALLVGAGSLHASIILSSADLGLPVIQNFGTAATGTLTPGAALTATFANVTLSSTTSTTLYYDPNGAGNCSLGKQGQGANTSPTLSPMTNCVGDYLLSNATTTPLNQAAPQATLVSNPEITLGFTSPETQASFIFAVPGGTGVSPTSVKVYNGNTLLDSATLTSTLTTTDFVDIVESSPFTSIQLSYVAGSYAGSSITSSFTWNAVLGNVEASNAAATPEPATMAMMGLGLAGIGYFFRRRKA